MGGSNSKPIKNVPTKNTAYDKVVLELKSQNKNFTSTSSSSFSQKPRDEKKPITKANNNTFVSYISKNK